jgi:hypothetical protein
MKQTCYAVLIALLFCSCKASEVGSATKEEALAMRIKEQRNVINPDLVPPQEALTMGERSLAERGERRGLLAPLAGNMVSLATDAVKKMIANDQKKYFAAYDFGLTGLYFYDQLSTQSPFDPVGMQFSGFKLIRTFESKTGQTDTALIADFVLDTVNLSELINNSMFRLRLRDLDLRYAKAKVQAGKAKQLNMDVEINFMTSYVSPDGRMYDSVMLGKFYLFLRKAPLDPTDSTYTAYYESLQDSLLTGKAFIVPRSFGYHRGADGEMKPGYSQGAYSIQVKVKETSKNNFVTKLVFDNANVMMDATRDQIKSKLGKKL